MADIERQDAMRPPAGLDDKGLETYLRRYAKGAPDAIANYLHIMWPITSSVVQPFSGPRMAAVLLGMLDRSVLLQVAATYYGKYPGGAAALIHQRVVATGNVPNSYARMVQSAPHAPAAAGQDCKDTSLPDVTSKLEHPELYSLTDIVRLYGGAITARTDPRLALNPAVAQRGDLPALFVRQASATHGGDRLALVQALRSDGGLRATMLELLQHSSVKGRLGDYEQQLRNAVLKQVSTHGHKDKRLLFDALYRTPMVSDDDNIAHIRLFGDGRFRAYRTLEAYKVDTPDISGYYRIDRSDLVFLRNDGQYISENAPMTSPSEFTWAPFPGARFLRVK